jgi:predicted nuclease of predicted toxin-antitoxin system
MRILLDESLPRPLREALPGHSVRTVAEMNWSAVENSELLRLAAAQFDVFVTADQNLQFQQNLGALPLSVVVLAARTNRIEDLRPILPELLSRLKSLPARTFLRLGTQA